MFQITKDTKIIGKFPLLKKIFSVFKEVKAYRQSISLSFLATPSHSDGFFHSLLEIGKVHFQCPS